MVKLADQWTIRFDHNSKFLRRLRFIPSNYSHKIYERFRLLILAHAQLDKALECVQEFVHDSGGCG